MDADHFGVRAGAGAGQHLSRPCRQDQAAGARLGLQHRALRRDARHHHRRVLEQGGDQGERGADRLGLALRLLDGPVAGDHVLDPGVLHSLSGLPRLSGTLPGGVRAARGRCAGHDGTRPLRPVPPALDLGRHPVAPECGEQRGPARHSHRREHGAGRPLAEDHPGHRTGVPWWGEGPVKDFARRMIGIDRRIIFLLIAAAVLLPLLRPFGLPIKISPEVRAVYDYIEALPERSVFLLSFDFDPSSKPELEPQAVALLRHAFLKNLRVIGMTHWLTGPGLADDIFSRVAVETGRERGKDYVLLGWSPRAGALVIAMGQDLVNAVPSDYQKTPTPGMPVLEGVKSLRDVNYMVSLAAGHPGIAVADVFGYGQYRVQLG